MVVNRFRISEIDLASFRSTLDAAVAVLRPKAGLESLRVLHNLDESDLWALVTIWQDVGSYRRALSGMESKMVIWPLFALAVNEPSAYLSPEELGDNRPRRQF